MKSTFQLFNESVRELFNNMSTYLRITSISLVTAGLVAFFEPQTDLDGNFLWESTLHIYTYTVLMLLSLVAALLTTIAVTVYLNNKNLTVTQSWKTALTFIVKNAVMSVIAILAIGIGFLLFILPGVWLSVSFMFAMYFIVLKYQGPLESLQSSYSFVKGRWWNVFRRLIVLGLLSLVILIPVFLASFVLSAFVSSTISYVVESVLVSFINTATFISLYLLFKELDINAPIYTSPAQEVSAPVAT